MKKVNFPLYKKLYFIITYIYYKFVSVWWEVKDQRLIVFIFNIHFFLHVIFLKTVFPVNKYSISSLNGCFGKYKLRPGTLDILSASPGYERQDINMLIGYVQLKQKEGKSIIFIDVGADIGTYSVAIGLTCDNSKLQIIAIEGMPESADLLKYNIQQNNLVQITDIVNRLVSDVDDVEIECYNTDIGPGSNSLVPVDNRNIVSSYKNKSITIDTLVKGISGNNTVLVVKMDIEGYESIALKGATLAIAQFEEVYFVVEDFVSDEIIENLIVNKFNFVDKVTSYNSHWIK